MPSAVVEGVVPGAAARRRRGGGRGAAARRRRGGREVPEERLELAVGAGGVGGADALLELLDVEPPGGAVLAERAHGGLALGVRGAQAGVARCGRGRRRGRPVGGAVAGLAHAVHC